MYQFHSSGQDQYTVVQQAEMTVDKGSLQVACELVSLIKLAHYAWIVLSSHSDKEWLWYSNLLFYFEILGLLHCTCY